MKSNRVLINEQEKEISIDSFVESSKQNLLTIWLFLWSLAGIGIISQFFSPITEGLTIYLVVWLAFWAYFEFKVIYAYRWRRFGKEVIKVEEEWISINRVIAGRGIPQKYELSWMKNLRLNDNKKSSFFTAMSQSYWSPGNEQLTFDHKGREIFFGMELSESESKFLLKTLKQMIQKSSS